MLYCIHTFLPKVKNVGSKNINERMLMKLTFYSILFVHVLYYFLYIETNVIGDVSIVLSLCLP